MLKEEKWQLFLLFLSLGLLFTLIAGFKSPWRTMWGYRLHMKWVFPSSHTDVTRGKGERDEDSEIEKSYISPVQWMVTHYYKTCLAQEETHTIFRPFCFTRTNYASDQYRSSSDKGSPLKWWPALERATVHLLHSHRAFHFYCCWDSPWCLLAQLSDTYTASCANIGGQILMDVFMDIFKAAQCNV